MTEIEKLMAKKNEPGYWESINGGEMEWRPYTDEEIAGIKAFDLRLELEDLAKIEQDDLICALYEENLSLQQVASDTDDAICYLYEALGGEE